ncbi:MAG: DUF3108 domain-containing protein [Hyphomonadaceae bacterium]|nr:DUF3108 domain-containing protein [Hyphomonadaceae bacterium]MBC6412172.1 DUF3108 domain-containing protein [Hyphomonadaceae bacterium]
MRHFIMGLLTASCLTGAAHGQIGPDHPLYHVAVHPEPPLSPPAKALSPLAARQGQTAINVDYSCYLFGLKIVSSQFRVWYDDDSYEVFTRTRSAGLGALATKLNTWSMSEGRYDENGMYPISVIQQNTDKKNRRVNMDYDYTARDVDVVIIPRNGSQGIPPTPGEEKFEADDVLSAMLNLAMRGHALNTDFCTGGIKVFDSKQHYRLRMDRQESKTVTFDGVDYDGYRCHIYYEPINGFDPEDLPDAEQVETPLKLDVINREDLGLYVPVRFTYKISAFSAVIKAKGIEVVAG